MGPLNSQQGADHYMHFRKLPEARESLERIRGNEAQLILRENSACCHEPDWKISKLGQSIKCREALASEMGNNLA